jgi:hypothetical protein
LKGVNQIPARLAKGTIENVEVTFIDNTGQTSDLAATGPSYDVVTDAGAAVVTSVAATASGMTVHCRIDTTISGYVIGQHYNLYVKFNVGTESPRIGPYDLYVI